MKLSKSSKKNLRYLSIANPYFCLRYLFSNSSQSYFSCNLKTLVSPKPSPIPSLNSDQFQSKPTSNPSYSFISSIGSSSFCHLTHPSCHSSQNLYFSNCNGSCRSQISKLGLLTSRCISSFAMVNGPYATPKQVSEIIELLRSGDSETESKLLSMSVSLSNASVIEILRVLNSEKVSALCFLKYMREIMPEFYKNSDICSLVIDNCGRLDDYETMRQLLNDFNVYQVCLNEKAFGFLPVLISSKALTKKGIWRVVEVLNQVGGSCLVSGVRALIEMFSVLGLYEMAKYVIKKTERKVSYYNILIKEMCRRCDFKGPRDLLVEMRQVGCEPITLTYNYVLGVLCKNGQDADACELLEEMLGRNCHPDAITYEIFIVYSCRVGKFDVAFNFFNQMVKRGLQPRLATHAAFIKGYFIFYRYEDAYKYVVLSADKYKSSSNMLYSLLASLHDKNNNPVMAKNVLSEMMKNGLRPNVSVYRRVLKHLHTSHQEHMAKCLSSRYSSLSLGSSVEAR
ncbi:hypothetical protein CISIN_1g047221mg [Citrus sinensis]|uniref:Pentacotripeptide-repeat region of PRORP domain-containing protein n=2 Tax=Citrus sinensis TaxID=2711 RepID=A0A067E996_CITSI|nr:hypothetical protein CISIN_1g047221mg [Citrus sinensis]